MTSAKELHAIASLVWLPVLGFVFIGASGVLFFRLHMKLQEVNDKSYQRFSLPLSVAIAISRAYLAHARQKGWSQWPVHLQWLCAAKMNISRL